MKCSKCGALIDPNDQFCKGCGAVVKRGDFIQTEVVTDETVDSSKLNHDFGPTVGPESTRSKILHFLGQTTTILISILIVVVTIIVIEIIWAL